MIDVAPDQLGWKLFFESPRPSRIRPVSRDNGFIPRVAYHREPKLLISDGFRRRSAL